MYHSIDQFLKDWAYEAEATKKTLANLTDASLEQRVTPDGRSLGRLAWHIAVTIPEMTRRAGLPVDGPDDHAAPPAKVAEIAAAYEKSAASLAECLPSQWTDAMLAEDVDMYGQTWKKGIVLSALAFHQCHHRGQMTVLMRQAGLKVPGIYGPAREEWEAFGMPAQE